MNDLILNSTLETGVMVIGAVLIGLLIGVPLAVLLRITKPGEICEKPWLHHTLGLFVNGVRSIPYIIFVVLMMPLTRWLVGTSIGTVAALIPLSLAGSLLIARVVETSLSTIPKSLIEVGLAMGAKRRHIITKILLSESLPSIISGLTNVIVQLIGYSAMAGAVGGGGLGDLAIRYGYQRYDLHLLAIIVVILVAMVQAVQMAGDALSGSLKKN